MGDIVGGSLDLHGCCISCGYSFCEALNKCIRIWETECPSHRRLGDLDSYNMNDLLLLIVGVAGAGATLCMAIQKSKCRNISVLYGCFKCDRDVEAVIKEEKLHLGKTISNEKKVEDNKNLDPVLNEPETEDNRP